MNREEKQNIIDELKELYGIYAIWFLSSGTDDSISDLVRLQLGSKNHLEFVKFPDLLSRISEYFSDEFIRKDAIIKELENLPYVHVFTGYLKKPVQKSFVELSHVINLLNKRRKECYGYNKGMKTLIKLDSKLNCNTFQI